MVLCDIGQTAEMHVASLSAYGRRHVGHFTRWDEAEMWFCHDVVNNLRTGVVCGDLGLGLGYTRPFLRGLA